MRSYDLPPVDCLKLDSPSSPTLLCTSHSPLHACRRRDARGVASRKSGCAARSGIAPVCSIAGRNEAPRCYVTPFPTARSVLSPPTVSRKRQAIILRITENSNNVARESHPHDLGRSRSAGHRRHSRVRRPGFPAARALRMTRKGVLGLHAATGISPVRGRSDGTHASVRALANWTQSKIASRLRIRKRTGRRRVLGRDRTSDVSRTDR